MPDTVSTMPLSEIVTMIRNLGTFDVATAALNCSGPEWPTVVEDNGWQESGIGGVRHATVIRMSRSIMQREALMDTTLTRAAEQIGTKRIMAVIQTTSDPGWMRACDEQAAIADSFGDKADTKAWSELAKHGLGRVIFLLDALLAR